MNFGNVIFLGILQGVTEFFPISSSGHLLLAEHFFALPVENLKAFDVVLHAGTLLALLVLFWREWFSILQFKKPGRQLFGQLIVATAPAAVIGLLFGDAIDQFTRGDNRVVIVASFFLIVAFALFLAEKFGKQNSEKVAWKNIFVMGLFQASALLPGISRSGATIAAGMFSGLSRSAAAKFSFLMLAPATAGAVILIAKKVFEGELSLPPIEFSLVGFVVSAIVSFMAASFLLRFIKKHSLKIFALYLILAAALLFLIK
jgi:undecaprenyl-diphosphatase